MADRSVRGRGTGEQQGGRSAKGLGPTTPTPTRIQTLMDLGLEAEELAKALDVTPTTVRNWARGGAAPRRETVRMIDDLRRVVLILAEAGIEGTEAADWLRSRQGEPFEADDRPLEAIRHDPVRVLASAHAAGLERDECGDRDLRLVSS
jgi:transcriptional regulator with XRE-family HTH domain